MPIMKKQHNGILSKKQGKVVNHYLKTGIKKLVIEYIVDDISIFIVHLSSSNEIYLVNGDLNPRAASVKSLQPTFGGAEALARAGEDDGEHGHVIDDLHDGAEPRLVELGIEAHPQRQIDRQLRNLAITLREGAHTQWPA